MNYDSVIEAALSQGESFEQIAAAFSEALNKSEERRRFSTEREAYIDLLLLKISDAADSDEDYTFEEAAAIATICASREKPTWSADRLRKFKQEVEDQLDTLISAYEYEETLVNNSKEEEGMDIAAADRHTDECHCGGACKKKIHEPDMKKVFEFSYPALSKILKDCGLM